MAPRTPSIPELRAFVTAADLGSVGRAAIQLGITQPALSKRLKSLEEAVGVRLLDRSPYGVQLSADGRRLHAEAHKLLTQAEAIDRLVEELAGEPSPVRLAVSPAIAERVLPESLAHFDGAAAGAAIELLIGNSIFVRRAVAEGRVDLGIAAADQGEDLSGDGHIPFAEDEIVAAVPPGHPWERLDAVPASELATHPLILRDPSAHARIVLESALAELGVTLAPAVLEVGTPAAAKAAIRARGVPALLARVAVDEKRDGLAIRPIAGLELRRRFWLLCGSERPAARRLAEHLAARA
jgi:DNA-binding transcriptional LysR family regulator